MSNKVLSQDEINSVLNAVQQGKLDLSDENTDLPKEQPVKDFDLLKQDQISRGRLPGIYMIFDRLSRHLQVNLSSSLRKTVEVHAEYASIMKYSECINQVVNSACFVIVRTPPLRGLSMIIFERVLVYSLLNSYFGGPSDGSIGNRTGNEQDFTPIELRMIAKFTELVFDGMIKSWNPVVNMTAEIMQIETNPQFVMIVPNHDLVVNSVMEVRLDGMQGSISVITPYSSIEPIKQKLSTGFQADLVETDHRWMTQFKDEMMATPVNTKVSLGKATIDMSEFQKLRVNDVIVLNSYRSNPLKLEVEGIPKFTGFPVVHAGSMGLRIEERLNDTSDI